MLEHHFYTSFLVLRQWVVLISWDDEDFYFSQVTVDKRFVTAWRLDGERSLGGQGLICEMISLTSSFSPGLTIFHPFVLRKKWLDLGRKENKIRFPTRKLPRWSSKVDFRSAIERSSQIQLVHFNTSHFFLRIVFEAFDIDIFLTTSLFSFRLIPSWSRGRTTTTTSTQSLPLRTLHYQDYCEWLLVMFSACNFMRYYCKLLIEAKIQIDSI